MWAVTPTKGLLSGDGPFPVDAVLIDEHTYNWLSENFDIINLDFQDGQVRASIDLPSYKRLAISKIALDDFTIHNGIKVFDYELAQVAQLAYRTGGSIYVRNGLFEGTRTSLALAINERNRRYHTAKSAIQNAETPMDVDAAMELYTEWQMN